MANLTFPPLNDRISRSHATSIPNTGQVFPKVTEDGDAHTHVHIRECLFAPLWRTTYGYKCLLASLSTSSDLQWQSSV